MPCTHVYQLHNLLSQHDLRPSQSDLLAIVCGHCNELEVCPSSRAEISDDSADGEHRVPYRTFGARIGTAAASAGMAQKGS